MKIQTYRYKIVGLTPLLMNNPAKMLVQDGGSKMKTSSTKSEDPKETCEKSAYRLANKQLYLPALQFRQSLIYASRGKKFGKRSAASILAACVFIAQDKVGLVDAKGRPIQDYEIDSRTAVNPSTGGRIMVHRPCIPHWCCEVPLDVDDDMVGQQAIKDLLNEAGTISGVGDYRPSCGGWFGRFKLAD